MSDIDSVIRYSKKLEKCLEQQYGASGRGLHEKASSVADQLDSATLKSLRWVATMRNKVVHEDDFSLDDLDGFETTCERLLEQLDHRPTVEPVPRTKPQPRASIAPQPRQSSTEPAAQSSVSPATAKPATARRKTPTPQPRVQPAASSQSRQNVVLPASFGPSDPPASDQHTSKQSTSDPAADRSVTPHWPSIISSILVIVVVIWALMG